MTYTMNIPDEMRAKYIERRKRDLEELKQAFSSGNLDSFQRIGHQLKGNGATYGYEELGELGQKMESAGLEKDKAKAETCLSELIRWVSEHSL